MFFSINPSRSIAFPLYCQLRDHICRILFETTLNINFWFPSSLHPYLTKQLRHTVVAFQLFSSTSIATCLWDAGIDPKQTKGHGKKFFEFKMESFSLLQVWVIFSPRLRHLHLLLLLEASVAVKVSRDSANYSTWLGWSCCRVSLAPGGRFHHH